MFKQINENQAIFTLSALVEFLGLEKAHNFILNYKNALSIDNEENITMKVCDINNLINNYKADNFISSYQVNA